MVPGSRQNKRLQLIENPRNRAILTTIGEADGPLHVEELAETLVAGEVDIIDSDVYEKRIEDTLIALHHNHLPRLTEFRLIEYDPASNMIMESERPADDSESYGIDAFLSHLQSGKWVGEDATSVITGRESVIEYGRQLADEADEELFCMYASTDLLEDECIRRAQNALDRGVTMYLGSNRAEVRDLTRKRLPEATIWEPQLDLLNTPAYPRVGRLVLADRESIMLAILENSPNDTAHDKETAIVASGERNPLVVLVRELLGPRIDHLDYQSEDFRSRLPP